MRKCLILIGLFLSIRSTAQEYFKGPDCKMEEVVSVDSVSAQQLYNRAKVALVKVFKSAKDVIQLDDPTSFELIAKGIASVKMKNPFNPSAGIVRFTMTIQCKDGRYKYLINDCVHEGDAKYHYSGGNVCNEKPDCGTFLMPRTTWDNIKKDFESQFKAMLIDFKQQMTNPTQSKDW